MDAVTAAVALIGEQLAINKLNAIVGMVKQDAEMQQSIVELVSGSASSGTLYSQQGAVDASDLGSKLNTQA